MIKMSRITITVLILILFAVGMKYYAIAKLSLIHMQHHIMTYTMPLTH